MQFALQYAAWHYGRGIHDTIVLWSNIIWFLSHFFSLSLLSSTLFAPWKRLREERKRGFNLEDILSALVVNIFMRILGFLLRVTVIAIGLVVLSLAVVLMGIHLVIWLAFPAVVPGLFYYGSILLFV